MTDQGERYDRIAEGYERWWAPVLAPSAAELLDDVERLVAAGARELIDVGVGTGNLAVPALERWPSIRVTGIDASREMIAAVDGIVAGASTSTLDRFTGVVADAAALPFDDGTFDAAMSSFVLQLVPNRARALREIRRVLAPGGALAYVTWLADRTPFAPDRVFDGLLVEFGFDTEGDDCRVGDVPSVDRAIGELRAAGYREVIARGAVLEHAFTVDGYIAFLVEFDEQSTFEEMDRAERRRFLARLRDGLMRLPEDGLVFRAPIVYASGRRSGT